MGRNLGPSDEMASPRPRASEASINMMSAASAMPRLLRPASRLFSTTQHMQHIPLWLDGKPAEAIDGATLEVEDPSTATPFTTTALGSAADIDKAVASAKAAHEKGEWRAMGARGRGKVLRGAAAMLRDQLPTLVELETKSTGRPRREYEAQLGRVPEWLEYHASLAESVEHYERQDSTARAFDAES